MNYYILDELENSLHEISESAYYILENIITSYDVQDYRLLKIGNDGKIYK